MVTIMGSSNVVMPSSPHVASKDGLHVSPVLPTTTDEVGSVGSASTTPLASPSPQVSRTATPEPATVVKPAPQPLIESNGHLPVPSMERANFNKWLLKAIQEDRHISIQHKQWEKDGRPKHIYFAFNRWNQEWEEKVEKDPHYKPAYEAWLGSIVSLARDSKKTICTEEMVDARVNTRKKANSHILQSDKSLSSFFSNRNNMGYIGFGFLIITLGLGAGIPALLSQFTNNKTNTGDDCVGLPYEPGRPVPNPGPGPGPGPDRPDQEMMFDSVDSSGGEDFFLNTDIGIAVSAITMVLLFAAFICYTRPENSAAPSKLLRNSEGGDRDNDLNSEPANVVKPSI
jgi:hypothetical protein